jgi:putative transposase
MGEQFQRRKHPAHGVLVSMDSPNIVFLTVCTKDRAAWLASDAAHAALLEAWREADAWWVGRYVLMPEHLHLFCAPVNLEMPLDN